MNNIYKVIWSKAKNCYVVASEIARSHTKSATGSGKIGGVTRRSLLASLMALSLLCGGLGVAEATVHVNEGTGVTSEVYTTGETYSRELVDEKLNSKANANDVATNTANIANLENNKLSKADASITYATKADVNTELTKKADKTYVDNALNDKADKADVYSKTDAENTFATKTELTAKADATALAGKANTDLSNLTEAGKTAIKTTMTDELAKKADNDTVTVLDGRVEVVEGKVAALETTVSDPSNGLVKKVTDLKTKTTQISFDPAKGTIVNGVDFMAQEVDAHGKGLTGVSTLHTTGAATIGGALTAAGLDAGTGAITGGSLSVTGEVKGNRVDAGSGEIKTTGVVNAGTLSTAGDATVGGNLNATGKVSGKGLDAGTGAITGGSLSVTGDTTLNKTDVNGALNVTGESNLKNTTVGGTLTAEKDATFEKNVTVEKDLTVNGKLNVDKISMKNDELKNGKKHDSATTITADEISNLAKVTDEKGNTTESQFTHNEKGTFNYAKDEKITGEWKGATSNVTADGVSNKMTDSAGNTHTYYQTAAETKEQLVNGNKSNFEKKTAKGNTISITEKDADGNLKSSLTNTQTVNGEKTSVTNKDSSSTINQGADQIRYNVTSKDANKTSSSIEVKADGITNTSKDGTITNDAKDIENNATGDITNTAQNGSIINKAENGNISNTAQNVTNEGTESVTNKVGKNEVKVSKDGVNIKAEDGKKITESVGTASRVVENDKITDEAGNSTVTTENGKGTTFGKEGIADTTNIYGDSIKTGTINARDTTTGKLTAGAAAGANGGRLTVDANDGVKGSYKSGNYISRSYILENTLTSGVDNDKDPTENGFVGSRTDHYMDGDKAKLDETVKDAAGSNVTNKTSTGTVTTITDGTTTTKTEQGVKDITNTAKYGTITNDAKNIVNNATDKITDQVGSNTRVIDQTSITDTVGTANRKIEDGKITDTAGDSTVTTENGKGTTFAKTGSTAYSAETGATLDTKIAGNYINTGRVDANELGVSDKDDQGNTAGLSVKAGEGNKGGIKGYATDKDGNKTYTKVTATENSFQVQDKDGNIKNHQVNTKDKSENTIKNGDKTNTVTSTADGTTFNNSKANTAFEGGTYTDTTIKGNTITTGKVTMDYADVMKDLGVRGNANITGKTTTGSLEVTGTSTLKGDVTMESNATVKKDLTVEGNTNLKNTKVDGTLDVTQKANFGDSVSIAKDLSVGGNATIKGDVTASSYKVGDKTYISAAGINANDQKITNVADGSISEGSKDAVNGGQLYGVKNDLEGKVNKVGANAAAMANLHPMEFDPDSKWNIAAAIGNYGSETAAALGAFYRPNDDVMVNLSTAFGTGENMVGGGVSVRLGKGGNKLSREETNALKTQVADLTARMDALLSVLNPNMSKDFPDVPENHWAYEAVSRLAGNDIVQGYPDGEFHGERTMTRYEMAEIIYNALSRGAEAEKELVEEFKPELQAMAASEKATAEKAEG